MKSSLSKNTEFYPPKHLAVPQIPLFHGFFGRQGGVSTGLYDSLNCSTKDDSLESVLENRRRIVACYGQPLKNLMLLKQVHGGHVVVADEVMQDIEADAVVTDKKDIVLGIQTADCLPILLYSETGVIGAMHGGWKSLRGGIVEHTVRKMVKLGANRESITAAIGPCARQASYEVRQDFYDDFCKLSPENELFFSSTASNTPLYYFDLVRYAEKKLRRAEVGVLVDTEKDSYADPQTYFSRRQALQQGHTSYGAQLSVIVLS